MYVQYGHILQFLRHWSITGTLQVAVYSILHGQYILHHAVYKDLQIKLPGVYMQGTLKAAVYGILKWQYILQVHCIDGSIPSVYTVAY